MGTLPASDRAIHGPRRNCVLPGAYIDAFDDADAFRGKLYKVGEIQIYFTFTWVTVRERIRVSLHISLLNLKS